MHPGFRKKNSEHIDINQKIHREELKKVAEAEEETMREGADFEKNNPKINKRL